MRIGLLLAISVLTWLAVPPKGMDDIYVLLPQSEQAAQTYEAQFFENYAESLAFAGIKAQLVFDAESVPENATLLLPWLTAPLVDDETSALRRIRDLARERAWTVLLFGEHTDLGGARQRVATLVGEPLLRDDLSVPPGNIDVSGKLRSAALSAWPYEAILNRGATVSLAGVLDKVLLVGDGWWAERNIGEWLWVGDYDWEISDRHGRLTLAAVHYDAGARWVVVGDNSLVINRQIIADPRALLRLLDLSTLLPALVLDIVLLLCGLLLAVRYARGAPIAVTVLTSIAVALALSTASSPPQRWQAFYLGQSGFDRRNFNLALAKEPRLMDPDWTLQREKSPLSEHVDLPLGHTMLFALAEEELWIGNVRLHDCVRMGRVEAEEGVVLQDAQACTVEGPGEVLVGSRKGAAVISIPHKEGRTVLVLDTAFLSQNAPEANGLFLAKLMKE
jgi:hypothetical protein